MSALIKNPLQENRVGKYNGNEFDYVLKVLRQESCNGQSWSQALEELFCEKMGVRYAVACNSGTSALHAALYALGVQPGDEVIIPALTVVMDAYVALHLGAVPVYADVNPYTFHIDPIDIEKKISNKTRVIIVVSLYGLPVDIDPIVEIARKYKLRILVDNAQTVLGKYNKQVFAAQGDIAIWSFEAKKHLSSGEGGLITTANEGLAVKARKFAGIGYKHLTATAGRTCLALSTAQDPAYERFDTVGLNYRMPDIVAAVGLAQLERVEQLVARRQASAKLFSDAIREFSWLTEQAVPVNMEHSYYTFAIKYDGEQTFGVRWKEFYNMYLEQGGDGFYGACQLPYREPALRANDQYSCVVAENLQPKLMQFKTNYRDLNIAKRKAEILHSLAKSLNK